MKLLAPIALLALAACVTDERLRRITLEDELLDADRDFAADVQARRLEGWVAAFDEHGSQVDGQGAPVTGREAIRAYMQGSFADPRFVLEWAPVEARVPEGGNLGFVWGRWTLRDAAGGQTRGRYLDIWKRDKDGRWRVFFDVGEPAAKD